MTGVTFQLVVLTTASIRDVKKQLCHVCCPTVEGQQLVYKGTELEQDVVLSETSYNAESDFLVLIFNKAKARAFRHRSAVTQLSRKRSSTRSSGGQKKRAKKPSSSRPVSSESSPDTTPESSSSQRDSLSHQDTGLRGGSRRLSCPPGLGLDWPGPHTDRDQGGAGLFGADALSERRGTYMDRMHALAQLFARGGSSSPLPRIEREAVANAQLPSVGVSPFTSSPSLDPSTDTSESDASLTEHKHARPQLQANSPRPSTARLRRSRTLTSSKPRADPSSSTGQPSITSPLLSATRTSSGAASGRSRQAGEAGKLANLLGGAISVNPDNLQRLQAMGFTRSESLKALLLHRDRLDAACHCLLLNGGHV